MKRPKGFTLIELLIAVSIFSIIALCLYSTFSGGIKLWRRQEETFRYSQGIRLALDMMARELRNSINYSRPPAGGAEVEADTSLSFTGEADKVSFITIIGGKIAKVAYIFYAGGTDKKGELKRKAVFQEKGFKDEFQKEEALIKNLDEASFRYAYESGEEDTLPSWKDSWKEADKIPQGVMITLTFQKGQEGKEEIFKKTVFIPTGVSGKEE